MNATSPSSANLGVVVTVRAPADHDRTVALGSCACLRAAVPGNR